MSVIMQQTGAATPAKWVVGNHPRSSKTWRKRGLGGEYSIRGWPSRHWGMLRDARIPRKLRIIW